MSSGETIGPAVYDVPLPKEERIIPRAPQDGRYAPLPNVLLAQNALWVCRLRWIAVGLLFGFGLFTFLDGLPDFLGVKSRAMWPFVTAAALVFGNILFLFYIRGLEALPARFDIYTNLWSQIIMDLVVLTVVVHFVGSMETHIAFVYLLHVVLACIFFIPRQSLIVVATSCLLFLGCILVEGLGFMGRGGIFVTTIRTGPSAPGQIMLNLFSLWAILLAVWYLTSHLSIMVRRRDMQLMETNIRLIEAQKERTRHMLHTTHELKSPFSAIHTNVQLLLKGYCGTLPKEALEVLTRISERCRSLTAQIQDMLQLANLRSEAQQMPQSARLDVAALLRDCLGQVEPAALQRGIVLESDLQPVETFFVEDHFKMVFLNLLSNAVNYSNEGGRVRIECRLATDGRPRVSVADEGIGIPPEKLPNIFNDYYRTEEAVRHNRSSTGLGLAIVKQVVQTHRLHMVVESTQGKGTRFTVELPPVNNGESLRLETTHG
jgi:signal transduction histidine kinase